MPAAGMSRHRQLGRLAGASLEDTLSKLWLFLAFALSSGDGVSPTAV